MTAGPTLLIILDGFGYAEPGPDNAISLAQTPTWDRLWAEAPHRLINGSGLAVGLPEGQMGNSEVGHMNLGAGRVLFQELTRINQDAASGALAENVTLMGAVDAAKATGGAVHLLGLLSPGGVHSHEDHILAMARAAAAQGAERVYIHAFLDGRDTPPRSAEASLEAADKALKSLGVGRVASVVGRYYAMDRDKRWDRVAKAYALLTEGAGRKAPSATEALAEAYARDESDEFVDATCCGGPEGTINDGDAVIFMNFRADRARELSQAFMDPAFDGFPRQKTPALAAFVTLTRYAESLPVPCAYAPTRLENTLGEVISQAGLQQLRVAETEKYAHVTFFFNGGEEQVFPGETRELVPSPSVATYDLAPEMSAEAVTDILVDAIEQHRYDLIVCNYANGDMVGHTGVLPAAIKAVETLDTALGRVEGALRKAGGQALITADHGNVEQMTDHSTGQPHTAHTCEPVPLIYVGAESPQFHEGDGTLADIAPTLLALMGLPQPEEMTGRSLLATHR
ncbi:MAG: 2,3-bisphosphoglycerate-independent phosphoglycerate mutase [Pseudomonadales bacterium]|nr:2,3-bisphosphoglycerate-independent phosphoglycerate mutase [Pseudomonadales bacterium]